ncbi:MAG TPA: peptidyl-alpha-hydroxyglycine alpha-amidating lyase family protein [Vicinamibacterales bacterium]|nr:peptidyl-alpha-hydroxyglycine alpha-amidating lyase family protein [Vicinamibacterales bacterium]
MRRVFVTAILATLALAPVSAQQAVPQLPFESVPNPLTMPDDVHFGEIAGVAVNSKKHVFVFSRGNSTGPAYNAAAAQLLEFDQNGKFVREIGKNLWAWSYAHAVRIDKQDNIWVVDKGSNMILRMNPQGRVDWVFGRRGESSHYDNPPDYASQIGQVLKRAGLPVELPPNNNPRNPVPVHRDNAFNQPTDVAWDSKGNSYFSDGYVNSRVAKVNAKGEWVASWGSLGKGPGQFDTPHGLAVSPADEIYVADRGNRRIQVLDTEGKYLREFIIDVPVDTSQGKIVYGSATPNATTGSQAPGAPDALCMTPGPNPVLFVGDLYPSRIYKVSLEGKVLGVYGQPGRNLGEFGWIHAIACPSEDEIWVGELINWRVQKLVTKGKGTAR